MLYFFQTPLQMYFIIPDTYFVLWNATQYNKRVYMLISRLWAFLWLWEYVEHDLYIHLFMTDYSILDLFLLLSQT